MEKLQNSARIFYHQAKFEVRNTFHVFNAIETTLPATKGPVHIPQLVFCALLSCTLWARVTTPWPIIVSYLAAHPIINPTCRLLSAHCSALT